MKHGMKKAAFLAALVIGLATIGTAPAVAGDVTEYVGEAERDPETHIEFELKPGKPKQVVDFIVGLRFACDDGTFDRLFFSGDKAMKVKKKQKFAGKLTTSVVPLRGTVTSSSMKVTGKLLRKGKAKGTVDAEYTHPGSGDEVRCYSGKLDWKAAKQAR